MAATRRTALAMLGLGTATAVGAETFSLPPEQPYKISTVAGAYNKERYAQAFENLARELRLDRVLVEKIDISATMQPDDIADRHELTVRFVYLPEAQS